MKVLKSYGTAGAVVVNLGADDPKDINLEEPVFITFDGLPVPFFIESCEPKGGRLLMKLEDIDSLEAAEKIVGKVLSPTEDDDECDDDDPFIGMTVYDQNNSLIGKVTGFNDYSGNTCIDVDYKGREVTLPVAEDLIIKVRKDKLYLTIPEGLL